MAQTNDSLSVPSNDSLSIPASDSIIGDDSDSIIIPDADSIKRRIDAALKANDLLKLPDTNFRKGADSIIYTSFREKNIELENGDIITNVLKVFNNSTDSVAFNIRVVKPADWRSLDVEETYVVYPRDTFFIPVVIIPSKLINSNTEVVINAFVLDVDGNQIADNYFTIKTKKKISWNINAEPSSVYYFRNDETEKRFSLSILNTGNSKQDLFVSYKALSGNLLIKDTLGNIVKEPNFTLSLDSEEDTVLTYTASAVTRTLRNFRKIPTNSYLPNSSQTSRKYNLYINATEPKSVGDRTFRKGTKVKFLKLPNQSSVQPFGYSYLPLTVEANVQNVLDDNVFMSINFRGFKQLNETASLSYFAQLNYSNSIYTNTFLQNSPWYIGYFDLNKTVEIGQLNSNVVGISAFGKGIKGSYTLDGKHRIGAFYLLSPGLSGTRRNESYGLSYAYTTEGYFRVTAKWGRQEDLLRNRTIDSYSVQPRFQLFSKHFFNFIGGMTVRNENAPASSSNPITGFLYGGNYSTYFIDKRLKFNFGMRFNDRSFSFGSLKRESFNHRSVFKLNEDWNVYLANQYQNATNFSLRTNTVAFEQELFSNTLNFSRKVPNGSVQPGLFYDYNNTFLARIHYRGAAFRYSQFNFLSNYLNSITIRAGYTMPLAEGIVKEEYFAFQLSTLMRYRVWSFTSRYDYGVYSLSSIQNFQTTNVTPQNIRLSAQNQYQLKNEHLILESNLIYNYNNTFLNHTVGFYPEMFYFSNTGWRFSIRANYTFATRKFRNNPFNDTLFVTSTEGQERSYNNDVNIGFTVRKDFGVPIPFAKKRSSDIQFIAFYDINGNGKKDKEEPTIEDVVIQLGENEVITNNKGESVLKNVDNQQYRFNAFALADIGAWFPNIEDTVMIFEKGIMHVPFVRGIKVYGDVVLDRQKIAVADTTKPFDLSRIRITANNGKSYYTLTNMKGRFEFYLPNGEYIISMDETILSNRYSLTRNDIPITLTQNQSGSYVSFFIVEKRKKVKVKTF